jgi:hypothetical protein
VDLVDEARDITLARTAVYQHALQNYHSRRIHTRSFNVADLVLRLEQKGHLKLESPWEGPYIVTEVIPGGPIASSILQHDWWKATHGTLNNCDDSMFRPLFYLPLFYSIRLLSHPQDNVYLSCILLINF